jgi:hypothetical protein
MLIEGPKHLTSALFDVLNDVARCNRSIPENKDLVVVSSRHLVYTCPGRQPLVWISGATDAETIPGFLFASDELRFGPVRGCRLPPLGSARLRVRWCVRASGRRCNARGSERHEEEEQENRPTSLLLHSWFPSLFAVCGIGIKLAYSQFFQSISFF